MGDSTGPFWKGGATPQEIKVVVEPAHRPTDFYTRSGEPIVKEVEPAANDPPQTHIARGVILDILAEFPPLEAGRRIGELSGLTKISGDFLLRIKAQSAIPDNGFSASGSRGCGAPICAEYGAQLSVLF